MPRSPLQEMLSSEDMAHRVQARELLLALPAEAVHLHLSSLPDLRGLDLQGVDLSACVLSGKDLHGADLSNACLRGVDLRGCSLDRSILRGADLRGANLSGLSLAWADLSGADLHGADLRGMRLNHVCLRHASLEHAQTDGLKLMFCEVTAEEVGLIPPAVLAEAVGLWGQDLPLPAPQGGPSESCAMASIPPGSFLIGSEDSEGRDEEKPRYEVEIPEGFWSMTTPVTQHLWQEVTGSNPSRFQGDDRRPVEKVSWCDAVMFANLLSQREGLKPSYTLPNGFKLGMNDPTSSRLHSQVEWDRSANGYRLPTEAEWEYMARAGTTSRYWSGDNEDDLARVGWFNGNANGTTHPVGEKPANPWGLYDVHGNVFEWCFDTCDDTAYQQKIKVYPVFSGGSLRVIRGGSWFYTPDRARAARRSGSTPGNRWFNLGVRLVRSAVPQR